MLGISVAHFYKHGLTLISTWIILYKVSDEINYSILNFNGATVEVYEWIIIFIPHFIRHVITHPCWK